MIIECEMCGGITEMEKFPMNNICPVCLHIGCLSAVVNPTKEQLQILKELKAFEKLREEKQ